MKYYNKKMIHCYAHIFTGYHRVLFIVNMNIGHYNVDFTYVVVNLALLMIQSLNKCQYYNS